jgi:hypothetical protein
MGLDTKTYWLTDRQSQCDFDFDFDLTESYRLVAEEERPKSISRREPYMGSSRWSIGV